ncbi:MAG: hypothetical protein WCO06_01295 [Candidatus Roizmanbacteria bacterium]
MQKVFRPKFISTDNIIGISGLIFSSLTTLFVVWYYSDQLVDNNFHTYAMTLICMLFFIWLLVLKRLFTKIIIQNKQMVFYGDGNRKEPINLDNITRLIKSYHHIYDIKRLFSSVTEFHLTFTQMDQTEIIVILKHWDDQSIDTVIDYIKSQYPYLQT